LNNQENGFQFGINTTSSTESFTVQTRLLGPFFNTQTPQFWQSYGLFIGTGDQDNYLKIALGADGGAGGIEILFENNGVANSFVHTLPGGLPAGTLDLYLSVDPATGIVQPKYAKDGGQPVNLGNPVQVSGALLTAIQGAPALAVGLLSTSVGSAPFNATWDFIRVYKSTNALTGTYKITARHSGKTLDVAAASYDNAARVIQWDYASAPNQQWKIEPIEGGYYKITAVHSGKALDVENYSLQNGGVIQQYDWYDTDNQKWSITDAGGGYYKIVSKNSGKALDVPAASNDNGVGITQWDYVGGFNQQWKLEQVSMSSRQNVAQAGGSTTENLTDRLVLYPNPANRQVQIVHHAAASGEVSITVRGAASQLQVNKNYGVQAGRNTFTLDVSNWQSGMYFLQLNTEGHSVTKKLVIMH